MKSRLVMWQVIVLVSFTLSCAANRPIERSPGQRETGRAFLTHGEDEEPGYGLYSYLLFGSQPNDATRQRYLSSISAYLAIPTARALREHFPASSMNITYLPLLSQRSEERRVGKEC